MKNKKIFLILFILLTIPELYAQSNNVTLDIKGFRNNNGKCIVYIHDKADGFPYKHIKEITFPITGKECVAVIPLGKSGRYAITVLHDENGNGKVDKNFIGIPKEGFGATNDARGNFGPPKFNDASFNYEEKSVGLIIQISY